MKKAIPLFLILLLSFTMNAQESPKKPVYFSGEIDAGNYLGINLNMNFALKDQFTLQFGYSGHVRESKSEPDDYTSGLLGLFTLGLSELHLDQMENYQILVGKIFQANEKGTIRLNISAGLGYTVLSEPTNWQPVGGLTLGENYTYDVVTSHTVSLILNPKVEFPVTSLFGFSLSPMLQINPERTFIGVGFGVMVGLLRERKE